MLGAIIDFEALGSVIVAALVAGVGVTAVFAVGINGAVRSVDLRRDGRMGAAAVAGFVAFLAAALCALAVAYGLYLMVTK